MPLQSGGTKIYQPPLPPGLDQFIMILSWGAVEA